MITCRDPAAMTDAEQIAEIAELFATAYLRIHQRKRLAESARDEALCGHAGGGDSASPAEERVA